jgi:outer membrane protein assembly factor BamB
MKRIILSVLICSFFWAVFLASGNVAQAEDWRQFRGENSGGRSESSDVPSEWSASKNMLWRAALPGPGSSSPIVSGSSLFVTSYSGYGVGSGDPGVIDELVRHLIRLDRSNGKILWNRSVPARLPEDPYRGYITEHGYASSTPVTDGKNVFVFFGKSGVLAYDFSGNEVWRVDVGKESSNRRWGSAASPILHGDHVIINASDESQSIIALDKKTGKEVWRAEAASLELAYGTPLIAANQSGGNDLVIAVPDEVWGLDTLTGKLRWFAETGLPGNICPTLSISDGVAYGFGGYPSQGSFAVRLGGKGDVSESHVLWKSRVSSYVASPVYHNEHLYWINDRGDAICVRASDGEIVFNERLPRLQGSGRKRAAYASLVYANHFFYAVTRFSGTYVFKAQPKFELVAQNQFSDDQSQFNGTPAISDDQLYLRSDEYLYAIGTQGGRAH